MNKALRLPFIISICLVFLDQASKLWIKSNLALGESIVLTEWFQLHFTENPGMAFGIEWGGIIGKYILSSFRVIAILGILWYMFRLAKGGARQFVLISFGVVLAGALGNVLDSLFYGLIFDKGLVYNEHYNQWVMYSGVAKFNTIGYAPMLLGNVVDMLYFPLWKGVLPSWIPIWGGEYFVFFRPIFNVADSCVTIGVILLYLSSRKAENWGNSK
ncbi:MAG: lipoprotein signal peptidase [Schleiferiaceae bacterium]|nr:lipoprotein signal peptidase [Schleiferiaceae bacterium]MDG1881581.1 lipoprotein signal peptidase [Schleiferiaceae bacterium]